MKKGVEKWKSSGKDLKCLCWNFKHIVKVSTRRAVNLFNTLMGYEVIEIVAPPEL